MLPNQNEQQNQQEQQKKQQNRNGRRHYDPSAWGEFLDGAQTRMDNDKVGREPEKVPDLNSGSQNSGNGSQNSENDPQDSENNSQNSEEIPKTYAEYKNAFVNHMREYDKEHSKSLNESLSHYEKAISSDFSDENYVFLKEKKLEDALSRCKVMVLTANPIEKAILHYEMVQKKQKIRRIISGTNAYFIFKWGKYWVAHIHQHETGSNKNLGTHATIYEALKHFTPNVIISLGVAFGIDYIKQDIGDVLVSRRILPYSENKRDEDKVKPDRSQDKTIDDWLHVRLSNVNGFLDNVLYGDILSGGSVMSSFREKDKICLGYTKSDFIIGGEMEGNALFQFARRGGVPGVVIKGICDWGVAKNDIFPDEPEKEEPFKKSLQALAMENAIRRSEPLFNDKEIFAEPKNEDTAALKKNYRRAQDALAVSQILILMIAFSKRFDNRDIPVLSETIFLINNPVFLICFSTIITVGILVDLVSWKQRKQSKRYINRELREAEDDKGEKQPPDKSGG